MTRPDRAPAGPRHGRRHVPAALILLLAAAGALVARSGPTPAEPSRGVLHVIWDAEPDAYDAEGRRFFLVRPDGGADRLLPRPTAAGIADADALAAWDRRSVEVAGDIVLAAGADPDERAIHVRGVRAADGPPDDAPALPGSFAARDFVTVLCRFADRENPPFSRSAIETVHGPFYPGMRQYYAELSWDPSIMAGSAVTDWYALPEPRSHYVSATTTNFGALVRDCTAAAEPDVDFTRFFGINLQFSDGLSMRPTPPHDVLSFGGSWTLTLNGQTRSWGVTWMSGEHHANYVVVAHEMGHALGWPHSSGQYGEEYDSRWDVMSAGYLRHELPWGWLTVHTIAHHKNLAGWVPAHRRWVPAPDSRETAIIRRTALPPADGFLMAQIPIGPNTSYTVEARRQMGHDVPLPGDAILIHVTQGARAYVIEDPERRGDPNGPGATWMPGETFFDASAGVSIAVDRMLPDGFVVTIARDAGVCTVTLHAAPEAGGTAELTGGLASADCGRLVTVLATPNPGWAFVNWTEDGEPRSANAALQVTVDTDFELVAHFAPSCTVTLAAEPAAGGAAAVAAGERTGSCGRDVRLEATPNDGWVFVRWSEGGTGVALDEILDVTLDTSRTLTATFVRADDLADRLIRELLGVGTPLTDAERDMLDARGNRNGDLDLGDLLAFLDRHPEAKP